jgi:putative flavoprotein involved in K+ transport
MTDPTPRERARHWLGQFDAALSSGRPQAAASLFLDDGIWRDLTSFTWAIRTLDGRGAIAAMLEETLAGTRPGGWRLDGEATETNGTIEAWLSFETATGRGRGVLRLRDGRAWTLMTMLAELKGHEEPAGDRRPQGVVHGALGPGRRSWLELREAEQAALGRTRQPYCLIVGGGQGGIALGARLKGRGVPALIVARHARPGDAWRSRYRTLVLHDPVWYDHMPYLPFPDHWPVFSPKDQIADWLEMYAKVMELNYWTSSRCLHARFDDTAREWIVEVDRAGAGVDEKPAPVHHPRALSGRTEVEAVGSRLDIDLRAGTEVEGIAEALGGRTQPHRSSTPARSVRGG